MARTNFLHLPPFAKFKSHSLSDYNPTSGQVSRFELKKVFNHSIFNQKQTNIGACEYNVDEIWRAFFVQAVLIFSNLVIEQVFYVSKDSSKFRSHLLSNHQNVFYQIYLNFKSVRSGTLTIPKSNFTAIFRREVLRKDLWEVGSNFWCT